MHAEGALCIPINFQPPHSPTTPFFFCHLVSGLELNHTLAWHVFLSRVSSMLENHSNVGITLLELKHILFVFNNDIILLLLLAQATRSRDLGSDIPFLLSHYLCYRKP